MQTCTCHLISLDLSFSVYNGWYYPSCLYLTKSNGLTVNVKMLHRLQSTIQTCAICKNLRGLITRRDPYLSDIKRKTGLLFFSWGIEFKYNSLPKRKLIHFDLLFFLTYFGWFFYIWSWSVNLGAPNKYLITLSKPIILQFTYLINSKLSSICSFKLFF